MLAELDKLLTQKKFTEVLKLGLLSPKKKTTDEGKKQDEPMVTEEGEMKVTDKPKEGASAGGDDPAPGTSTAADDHEDEGEVEIPTEPTPMQRTHSWVKGKKLPPLYQKQEKYKGGAGHYSLSNASQLIRICEYLWTNGRLEICKTPLDGACLYHSMRWGADFPQEYVHQLIKRQIIVWMAQNADYCLNFYGDTIKGVYGGKRMSQAKYERMKKSWNSHTKADS